MNCIEKSPLVILCKSHISELLVSSFGSHNVLLHIFNLHLSLQENFLLRQIFDLGPPIAKKEIVTKEERWGKVSFIIFMGF